MEIRCRSPPERVEPFSPDHRLIALGQLADELVALAALAASSTSSSVAPRRPRRMFSITVSRNSTTS